MMRIEIALEQEVYPVNCIYQCDAGGYEISDVLWERYQKAEDDLMEAEKAILDYLGIATYTP